MPTAKLYLADLALTGSAIITALIPGEPPIVRLNQTLFHPQGGEQKADRGTIGGASVQHVRHADAGEVDHCVDSLAGLEVGQSYPLQVDQTYRALNAAYHTAGHLIAGIVEQQCEGVKAVAGHQWPDEARVEFIDNGVDLATLEQRLISALSEHYLNKTPVAIQGNPFENRAIQIGDYPPIPCGGTHVQDVGAIGYITIDSIRRKSDKIRVSYHLNLEEGI